MVHRLQIIDHMEVVGSDGGHVGRVDHVRGFDIDLTRIDTSTLGRHKTIPMSWVDYVDDKIHLLRTTDEARTRWTDTAR